MINLKTLLKNEEELKIVKVTSISEQAGNVCEGWKEKLKDFCPKKLLPSQASKLVSGNMGGCCKPPGEIQRSES